jgi:alkylmercury lyase
MDNPEQFEIIAHYLRTELFPDSSALSQRIALALYRQVSEGVPVTIRGLGDALGIDEHSIARTLADIDPSRLNHDKKGNITAFAGLSQTPAPHRFLCKGQTLYTWCVFDALFLPKLLGAEAQVSSICPVTRTKITLLVAPDGPRQIEPPTTVMSFVMPGPEDICGNLRGAFCNHVNFFATRKIAMDWQKGKPNAAILSLDAAFKLGQIRNQSFFNAIPHEL